MKNSLFFWATVLSTLALCFNLVTLSKNNSSIRFESLESQTKEGKAVFNEVTFKKDGTKDVWLMRQSHAGLNAGLEKWDRLAIVVDPAKEEAIFYQFKPGQKLEFASQAEAAPYRARCYACHANGPRAIRPNFSSSEIQLSFPEKARIILWNLKIKTYGKLSGLSGQSLKKGSPFKSEFPVASRPLDLKSCTPCHSQDGIRSPLRLEHVSTARFLIQKNIMPPFPFRANPGDLKTLENI